MQELWAEVDERGLLPELEPDVPGLADVKAQLVKHDFASFADLDKREQAKLARSARKLSEALIQRLDVTSAISRYWRQRLGRGSLVLAAVALLGVGGLNVRDAYRMSSDLAQGKAWTISSSNRMGCASPAQVCERGKDFFFHTLNQAQPWFMLDLGQPQRFSSVYIENRKDCCYHRAIPLVVEVSSDGKTWREVARRTEVFTSFWRADFPAIEARFVRLRIERWNILHLAAVKVLP